MWKEKIGWEGNYIVVRIGGESEFDHRPQNIILVGSRESVQQSPPSLLRFGIQLEWDVWMGCLIEVSIGIQLKWDVCLDLLEYVSIFFHLCSAFSLTSNRTWWTITRLLHDYMATWDGKYCSRVLHLKQYYTGLFSERKWPLYDELTRATFGCTRRFR